MSTPTVEGYLDARERASEEALLEAERERLVTVWVDVRATAARLRELERQIAEAAPGTEPATITIPRDALSGYRRCLQHAERAARAAAMRMEMMLAHAGERDADLHEAGASAAQGVGSLPDGR